MAGRLGHKARVSYSAMALVPAGSQQNQGSGFAQQGTVDWISLGQTQFSASIAVLGRLSSAGVEPLTVAVGQAICSSIPLGIHGEKVLAEAMSRLRACSSFGDVVWFGVGVRHILRVLVQTSQGASLVALCAGLSEGHNLSTSALVLYEMAKLFGSPQDLSPSFKQWEALVKVCSSVFSQSTLGLRIHKLLRLGGYAGGLGVEHAGHPHDMAEVLLAVGRVATGSLKEISIRGGSGCSWVAAYADQVLGLRVAVRSDEGAMLWMNYDGSVDQGHISLQFCDGEDTEAISCVGRIFYVRHGDEFIRQFFSGLRNFQFSPSIPFQGGRIQWDSMFSEAFGRDFEDLMSFSLEYSKPPPGSLIFGPPADNFARLFLIGAAFFVFHTSEACRYRDITEFVLSAMSSIPELRQCKHKLLDTALQVTLSAMTIDELSLEYEHSRNILARHFSPGFFCSARITETIIIMSYLLGRLTLEGSLLPKRSGILKIYSDVKTSADTDLFTKHGENVLRVLLSPDGILTSLSFQFARYVSIFSEEPAQFSMGGSLSAISDGKVYCFIDTLQGLSDSFEKASMIHVGAGSIQAGNRLHERVYDHDPSREHHSIVYQAQSVQQVEKNLCPFAEDSTSPDLSINAAVEESVRLSFWYRISSKLGVTLIPPGSFVQIQLREAIAFKIRSYPKTRSPDHSEQRVVHDQYFSVIYGEGLAPQDYSTRIILRPHRGNVLGRCIALKTSSTPVALLGSESDLSQFMEFWDHKTKTDTPLGPMRYTLIS